jgi:hypothetical protein
MLRAKLWSVLALGGIAALAGCDLQKTPPASSDVGDSTAADEQARQAIASEAAAHVSEGNPEGTPPGDAPVVARAGVGKEGQSLQNETGIGRAIAQPAITLFAVKQRAVFEIQIPQAMNLFEALEGRKPKDHDEFMNKIIKANNINLPELPAGKIYRYHPDDAQLYVESAP